MRNVVGQRLIGWYRALVFSSGSIVATTGFTIYGLIDSNTMDQLKDSITTTLMNANTSYEVDYNSITIIQQFIGTGKSLWTFSSRPNRHEAALCSNVQGAAKKMTQHQKCDNSVRLENFCAKFCVII